LFCADFKNKEKLYMNLIFENGEKLYQSEKMKISNFLHGIDYLKLYPYQKIFINKMLEQNKTSEFNIYGDDFKIKIEPINIDNNCVLSIADYNENQRFESEINIDFNKDELDQFINLLKIVRNKMK